MAAFFGYGSLVNTQTHTFTAQTATLRGWRRCWVATDHRDVAILSVLPDIDTELLGLTAPVPDGDWAALDKREAFYDRIDVSPQFSTQTVVYSVPDSSFRPRKCPIWLSYLDVVLQGYLHQFGADGPEHFMATTDGWECGIQDDRAAPNYPRAQVLTPQETAMVDRLTGAYRR